MNVVDFNDPAWRSPMTSSTREEILRQRAVNMEVIRVCNVFIVAWHAEREEERQLLLVIEAEEKAAKEKANGY